MLGAYDVKYMPQTTIKGQILEDFVAEFTEGTIEGGKKRVGVDNHVGQCCPPLGGIYRWGI